MKKISKNIKPARLNIVSRSSGDTKKIAQAILLRLKPQKTQATIVGLYGELGTGKTTLTQFLVKEIGIKRKVSSPTFVIMKNYSIPKQVWCGAGKIKSKNYETFFHIDAYRLKNEKELFHLGWDKIISNKGHLVFIEWPENVIKALPKKHHKVHITHTKEGYRKFQIKKP